MKAIFYLAFTLMGIIACLVAVASAGSLLLEAVAGERRDFGALGISMLAVLIVGQCRALWVLLIEASASAKWADKHGWLTRREGASTHEAAANQLSG